MSIPHSYTAHFRTLRGFAVTGHIHLSQKQVQEQMWKYKEQEKRKAESHIELKEEQEKIKIIQDQEKHVLHRERAVSTRDKNQLDVWTSDAEKGATERRRTLRPRRQEEG